MIVAIGFLSMGIWLGTWAMFSVFMVALLDEFPWGRATAAGVQSTAFIVYTCAAPLVGTLIDRFRPRRVILPGIIILCAGLFLSAYVRTLFEFYITFVVIAAFGVTFVSIVSFSAILSHWFEKKRGLASGIAVSGMRAGAFALVPLTQYVISTAGWRLAFIAVSGLVFVLLVPLSALFLRHKPAEMGLVVDGPDRSLTANKRMIRVIDTKWANTEWTLTRTSRERRFWFLLVFSFLAVIPIYLVFTHAARPLFDLGFNRMEAAFVIAVLVIVASVF